jgi:multimeric flavodoxin WrbA
MTTRLNKRAIILFGSPRKNGNTAIAIEHLEEALSKRHWKINKLDLYRMKFKGCAHCDHCKKIASAPACKLQDDLRPTLDDIVDAQLIVLASPVYCWSVSGCVSAALDRFYCFFKADSSLLAGKKMIGVFTSAGDEFDGMDLCVDMLKRLSEYGQMTFVGTLAGAGCTTPGATRKRTDLKQRALMVAKEL